MSIDPNDPRLTAYALGELDERESVAFAAEMDAVARAEVAAIRRAAETLRSELAAEPEFDLEPEQVKRITEAAGRKRMPVWKWTTAVAAMLIVGLSLWAALAVPGELYTAQGSAPLPEEPSPVELQERPSESPQALTKREQQVLIAAARAPGLVQTDGSAPRPIADGPGASGGRRAGRAGTPQINTRLADAETVSGSDEFFVNSGGFIPPPHPNPPRLRFPPPNPVRTSFNTEGYDRIVENDFLDASVADTSTFSVDVDTASYANVRRYLMQQDRLPPPDAVRIEEMINYFEYAYAVPSPDSKQPFVAHVEIAGCPWNPAHRLARIGIKGKSIPFEDRPPMNLVLLIDVSGSMSDANKLPWVKQSLGKLASELLPSDQIAIVVYAGAAGLVLETTPGNEREKILRAIDRLSAGGSTNGGQGIQLAYDTAEKHFIKGGVNRVILATDGDFNVGVSDQGSLLRVIEERATSGVFLSVLGFGMGNYKDDLLEKLSNSGNGNYAYIDSLEEACRVLVDGVGGTLITIAKDVKVQVFFNPRHVAGYRLIGYENRVLETQDFNDDTKDAGEIGVGHSVTALYEIVPEGVELPGPKVDQNPFVEKGEPSPVAASDAWFRLRMRYKEPESETSTLLEEDAADTGVAFDKASADFQWAAAVASFGMLLRRSEYSGNMTLDGVLEIAESSLGADRDGYRNEFLDLVRRAKEIWNR